MAGTTNNNSLVARDAYGFSLNYFMGDYKSINANVTPFAAVPMPLPANTVNNISTSAQLFNGNIGAMLVNIPKLGNAHLYGYQYDQLNRIVRMDAFTGLNAATNNYAAAPIRTDNYHEAISYDPNGNIKTYERNGTSAGSNLLAMDKLTYQYEKASNGQLKSNKLRYVHDQIPDGNYADDINSQKPSTFTVADVTNDVSTSLAGDNFGYDAIGNLIKDTKEGINNIEWTVYGKISKIIKSNATIYYNYDAAGNRISKTVSASGVDKTTYYVRDASGNVMSVYTHEFASSNNTTTVPLSQTELHLYGSSRLGVYNVKVDVQNCLNSQEPVTIFTRANKFFELSNHLGNVLVTISDKKIQQTANNSTVDYYVADVVTANDYYPFGMTLPGRKYLAPNANKPRYGFNGKEKLSEITNDDYDYGARIYDGRIGRWLSTDIVTKPFISPYNYSSNNPVNYLDPNGEDNIHFYYVIVRQYADGKLITAKPTKFYTVEKTNTANVFVHHKYELRYDGVGSDGKGTFSKSPVDTRFYPDVPGSASGLTSSYGGYIKDNDRKTLIKFIDEYSVSKQSLDIDYTELNSAGSSGSKRLQNAQWWGGVFKEKAFLESQEQEQNNRASFVLGVVSIFGGEALLIEKILGKVTSAITSIDSKAFPKLVEHGFRAGRNADIGLSTEIASVKAYNTLMSNASRLKVGDNELLIKINGIQKTITANISEEGVLRNINMIPGVSNRTKIANKIDLGKTTW